jgi:putative ABC transport system permease protein
MDEFSAQFFRTNATGCSRAGTQDFSWHPSSFKPEKKSPIQDLLVREFPTVSILDVERTGRKIFEVVGQMTWALQVMAALVHSCRLGHSLLCGTGKSTKPKLGNEFAKSTRVPSGQLRRQVWIEFGIIGRLCRLIGVCLSLGTSYLLSVKFLTVSGVSVGTFRLVVIICVVALSVITADFAARKALREKPARLLREG